MKKGLKILFIIIVAFIVITLLFFKSSNMSATINAVVIEVYESGLGVMRIDDESNSLLNVRFSDKGNIGLKRGQEIKIYFNGIIAASYPGQILNTGKIKIVKDESDVKIPDDNIRYYDNSTDKVSFVINEFNSDGITFTITDRNDLPYNYSNEYALYKQVKNKDYTGEGYKIGEDTENSISGYTGTGTQYIMEEMEKESNAKIEDTIEDLDYNLPNMTENNKYIVVGKKIDWTKLYGKLDKRKI